MGTKVKANRYDMYPSRRRLGDVIIGFAGLLSGVELASACVPRSSQVASRSATMGVIIATVWLSA